MRVSTFLYVRVCAPEKERDTHRKMLFRITHGSSRLGIIGKDASLRESGGGSSVVTESRKTVGVLAASLPTGGGAAIMNGRNSGTGGLIGSNRNLFVV